MNSAAQIALLVLVCAPLFEVPTAVAQTMEAQATSTPAREATPADIELRKLRPGVWIHTSYYTYPSGTRLPANGLVVRDGEGLLLVDMAWGESLTRALLDRIEAEIGLPVRRAVVTHSHHDRVAGVDVLEARGVRVYAHALTQRRTIGQGMPVPDSALAQLDSSGASVRLGAVEIFYPGPGHAPDNLMVWVASERVLFGGCAVRAASSNSLGSVADADLDSWPKAIRRARTQYMEAEVIVPGHGDVGGPELLEHTLRLFGETGPGGV